MTKTTVSAEFNFAPHYAEVLGSKIHYIEAGEGDPILFIHGIPTWSYVWRNIIPALAPYGHCIAPDLIGMGKSDKPDIEYTIFDHIKYIDAFIEQRKLKNVTLVLHGWGSLIGFDYAMRHPKNVKAIAFLEGHIRPAIQKDMVALPVQERSSILNTEDSGYDLIMNSNHYVNKVMPAGAMRKLTDAEMAHYLEPFHASGSNKPIWQYLHDLPLGHKRTPVLDLISNYSEKLQHSKIPKLMLYAMPGFNTSIADIVWAKEHLPNLEVVEIDDALHYAQESRPEEVSAALVDWYTQL
jgi:haloalkane dehalogenase